MPQVTKDIDLVVNQLINNEIVAIPTETVYGLAASMMSTSAINKVFQAKKRPHTNPLIVHIKDKNEVLKYVKSCPEKAQILMEKFWPGSLTILFEKNEIISDLITAGSSLVALRVPNHPITLQLLQEIDVPLVAPSANPFTRISPTTSKHVMDLFTDEFNYVLEGGACEEGIESTIIGFEENQPIVYRLGAVGINEIEKYIGKVHLKNVNQKDLPGNSKKHYSPRTRCVITQNIYNEIIKYKNEKIGVLLYKNRKLAISPFKTVVLSPNGTTKEALFNLYTSLHWLDQQGVDIIIMEEFPNDEYGLVINDRLQRASNN